MSPRWPPTPAASDADPAPRPTTVLVDRESLYRWFASESLGARGVDVVCCTTLGEADAYVDSHPGTALLLVDEPTIRGEGERGRAMLRRLSHLVRCVVFGSEPDRFAGRPLALTVVDKPDDNDGRTALLDRQLRLAG
jgi:hypothetical protein